MRRLQGSQQGAILIFALWVLSFLTVLAVSMAAGIRQQMTLVKRIDERSRMNCLVQSGIKKASAYLREQLNASGFEYSVPVKMNLHNNPGVFAAIRLGNDEGEVSFTLTEGDRSSLYFGVVDEERKININHVNKPVLAALIARVLAVKDDDAQHLAGNILDWRQYGQGQQQGFFSDEYYANLQYPYRKKDADYETLDELLLVKGIDKDIFEKLLPYITIYGDGHVNINTAPREVLSALGFDDDLILKMLEARRGRDELEATADDHVFTKTFDIASEVNALVKISSTQIREIDTINALGLLACSSSYFTIQSSGRLLRQVPSRIARVVYAAREGRIIYWKEK